jgi:hypothetical protein
MPLREPTFIRGKRWLTYLLCLAACLCCEDLRASSPNANSTSDEADRLFEDGKRLRAQGMYPEACLKFEESYGLEPAGGTILHLAVCHVDEGKSTLAWIELNEALRLARRDKHKARLRAAQKELHRLASSYPRLSLRPADTAALPAGMRISVDGIDIPQEYWPTGIPIEPGDHVITASAYGFIDRRTSIQMNMASIEVIVELPGARPVPTEAPPPARAVPKTSTSPPKAPISSAKSAPKRGSTKARKAAPEARSLSSVSSMFPDRSALGVALSGFGMLGMGLGAAFAIHGSSASGSRDSACFRGACTHTAIGIFIASGITSAIGVRFLFAPPPAQTTYLPSTTPQFKPSVRVSSQGLSISGEF